MTKKVWFEAKHRPRRFVELLEYTDDDYHIRSTIGRKFDDYLNMSSTDITTIDLVISSWFRTKSDGGSLEHF